MEPNVVKTSKPHKILGSYFYKYFACPHWIYFDLFGDPAKKGQQTRFGEMLLEAGLLYEREVIKNLHLTEVQPGSFETMCAETIKLMTSGVEAIYHGALMDEHYIGEPDILERHSGHNSKFGSYYYAPVDIKNSEKVNDAHRFQLLLYAKILENMQEYFPEDGYIINSSGAKLGIMLKTHEADFNRVVGEISEIIAGHIPPLHVSSGCKQSPWFKECIAIAESRNDISLLYNVKKVALNKMRECGIHTIDQIVESDFEHLATLIPEITKKTFDRLRLQAQALLEKKFVVRNQCQFIKSNLDIFFDIEGDPVRDVEYLFGFLVRSTPPAYKYFLAEQPEQEKQMWTDFLVWLETLPEDYAVYHYGTYEAVRLNNLEKRYGGSTHLNIFRAKMTDLNELVKENVIFPLYFYSLKDIGEYIGFKRSKKITGGGESVSFYEDWLSTSDRQKLDAILIYNEDDVIATAMLKDWLVANCTTLDKIA